LLRHDPYGQLFAGQVGARQLQRFGQLGLIDIDGTGLLVAARLQLFKTVLAQIAVVRAWLVVIRSHQSCLPWYGALRTPNQASLCPLAAMSSVRRAAHRTSADLKNR